MKYEVYTKEKGLIETDNHFDFKGLTFHNEDGPAYTERYKNNNKETEQYYIDDKCHRLDGPAVIWYNTDNTIDAVEYYINNKELTFEEWQEHPSVKAKTIEVDSKKELDALAKKDKEGIKTDDYFISSTGKYPIVYTLKESKVFESFKEVYVNKNKHTISREIRQMIDKDENFGQFVNENYYRDNTYKLGKFLKQQFPNVEFIWDEDSKGWWTTDEKFLNKYSSERTSYNYDAEEELKRVFRSQNHGQKLIVNSDFDKIQITLD